ncbi:uncharacterized protein LOC135388794 isoform X3 [Ornithodoros turicata]|uniref:uncharacterized protein LOC135388794 isoform X3 n=1 Tax=Ornithodoros turicata TaxID=34597 RepID=UPI00313A1D2D
MNVAFDRQPRICIEMESGFIEAFAVMKTNDTSSSNTSNGEVYGPANMIENGYCEQELNCEPHLLPSSCDEGSSASDVEDDEWRPSPRKRPRKTASVQRSQATRLVRRRKQVSNGTTEQLSCTFPYAEDLENFPPSFAKEKARNSERMKAVWAGCSATGPRPMGPLASWQQRKLARLKRARHRGCDKLSFLRRDAVRYPLCWSDTTLGSAMAGKAKAGIDSAPVPSCILQESRLTACKKTLPNDTGCSEMWKEPDKCIGLRSGPHRACRPKLFHSSFQSDDEDAFERSEKHLKLRRNGANNFKEAGIPPMPNSRPRLLQKRPVEKCSLSDESPCVPPEPPQAHRPRLKFRSLAPRMLSRGNYVVEKDSKESPERPVESTEVTRCSRKKKLSLAAKQRWERRRAKNEALNGQGVHCAVPPFPLSNESSVPKSAIIKAAFVLPAKLRWKWNNGCSDPSSCEIKNESQPIVNEDKKREEEKKEYFSMPAKLRWKHGQAAQEEQYTDTSHCHRHDSSISEGAAVPQEDKVNRRSHAKKLWWQRMKTFTAESTLGQAPIPKFLQAELFPNIRMKRRKSLSARNENHSTEAAEPSKRSLAMKENWRKRKQAWIQAAAKSVAAFTATPSNLAADLTSLVELGNATELAESMFLTQCTAEMTLLESTRSRNSSRHYNTKGVHIASNQDLCDCLDLSCPGCHYPCPKCRSPKCGHECRCSRHFVYEQIEIDGTDTVIKNQLL